MTQHPRQMRFSANPALELKRIDELPPAFAELAREYDAVLIETWKTEGRSQKGETHPSVPPSAFSLLSSMKAVDRETAEIFRSLAAPRFLDVTEDLIDLVLDGVLVVDDLAQLLEPRPANVGTLARDALQHAAELETNDVAALTNALYTYNRLPRTRAWAARFPDRASVLAHLGNIAALERNWVRSEENWIAWQPRVAAAKSADAVTWKLYVSPRPECIRDAFQALARVLPPGAAMKIGPDAGGLLRPDKLMAYFTTKEQLDATAHALASELRGCPGHGVPFTAPYDDEALLSWGADPPESDRALSWLDRESWRLHVAKSLAGAMSIARRASIAPVPFAVERVRRLGIDVETWSGA